MTCPLGQKMRRTWCPSELERTRSRALRMERVAGSDGIAGVHGIVDYEMKIGGVTGGNGEAGLSSQSPPLASPPATGDSCRGWEKRKQHLCQFSLLSVTVQPGRVFILAGSRISRLR